MTRSAFLAAGVLSLILVGSWTTAAANPSDQGDQKRQAIDLFGLSVCLPDAAPDLPCDWRLPKLGTPKAKPARVLSLLGVRICFGQTEPDQMCHLRLPEANPQPADRWRASL